MDEQFPDTKNIRRIDKPGYSGWQFVVRRKSMPETKHFNDSKFGGKEEAYKAAIAYRNEYFSAADAIGLESKHDIPLTLTLSPRNTTGIVGVSRLSRDRGVGKKREEGWVANYKDKNGKAVQDIYNASVHGERNALLLAIGSRKKYAQEVLLGVKTPDYREEITRYIEELEYLELYIQDLDQDSEIFFFLSTINNPLLKSTEKQSIINARVGQRKFRRLVLDYWGNRCAATGASLFLNAGHIKPWSKANDTERLDVYNGICFSPVYDRAFDSGEITFNSQGFIVCTKNIILDSDNLGISREVKINGLTENHQHYLAYHRKYIFKGTLGE